MSLIADMEIFAIVVQCQSFTKAGVKLDISKSYVSKVVSRLEKELGAKLLNRSTRHLSLTETGRQFFFHCQKILEEAELAISYASSTQQTVQGLLRVTAPIGLSSEQLPCFLDRFYEEHPNVNVEVYTTNTLVDIISEGYDCALRLGPLKSSNLIAKMIYRSPVYLLASPDYIKSHGSPECPADLAGHQIYTFSSAARPANTWTFTVDKQKVVVNINPNFVSNNGLLVRNFMMNHSGIALAPYYSVKEQIEQNMLVPIMTDYEIELEDIFAVYPDKKFMPKKVTEFVRLFSEFMSENYAL